MEVEVEMMEVSIMQVLEEMALVVLVVQTLIMMVVQEVHHILLIHK